MEGLLVRVGIDLTAGGWNAPVDPDTLEFAYVPIPDRAQRAGLATPYAAVASALRRFPGAALPAALARRPMHLDPDFERLTYGDDGAYRVRRELLARWGGLSCRDGWLQRSAVPPAFREPARFLAWLAEQRPELVAANDP